jgi:hypothetical protein
MQCRAYKSGHRANVVRNFRPLVTMSCEFCKEGNCCQKGTTSSAADALGFEDPSQLANPESTPAAKPPIEKAETRECNVDANGVCCRMSGHVQKPRL